MRASLKWNIHRLSSVSLIFFITSFIFFFITSIEMTQIEIQKKISEPFSKFLLLGFIINSVFHARLELWNIYDDYFKSKTKFFFQKLSYIILFILLISFLPILGVDVNAL